MKIFLCLFPIAPYIEGALTSDRRLSHLYEEPMDRYNQLVEKRYRAEGFQIYWVLSDPNPLSPKIVRQRGDQIIQIGSRLCPDSLIQQIPSETTEIRLAGFHLWCCVDAVGRALYEAGYKVLVDEDLTELYFSLLALERPIPDEFDPEEYRAMLCKGKANWQIELARGRRERSPWVVQI